MGPFKDALAPLLQRFALPSMVCRVYEHFLLFCLLKVKMGSGFIRVSGGFGGALSAVPDFYIGNIEMITEQRISLFLTFPVLAATYQKN